MFTLLTNSRMPDDIIKELEREFTLICPPDETDFTDDEIQSLIRDADAFLCLRVRRILPHWLDASGKLKVIGNVAVGYDNIDVPYAAAHNVAVVNTPKAVLEATAEHTIALMLSITRGIARYNANLKKSLRCSTPFFYDRDVLIYGKTLGIIGCGRVGKAVASRAQGLGMKVIYYDPFRMKKEDEEALDLMYKPFDEVLRIADVISIHMPYTKETHHLLGEAQFKQMRRSAYFINAARGPIVEEAALINALKSGTIRGAALDVFEFEPLISPELAQLDNVVIVPHVGTMLLEVRKAMVDEAVSGIRAVLDGELPMNLVKG